MSEMRLEGRPGIEAYISKSGLICLKQGGEGVDDPHIIFMLPTDIPQIVEWLEQLAAEYPLAATPSDEEG